MKILANSNPSNFREILRVVRDVEIIRPEECVCLSDVEIPTEFGRTDNYQDMFGDPERESIVLFLMQNDVKVENPERLVSQICEKCRPLWMTAGAPVEELAGNLLKAKAIVSDSQELLGNMFLLPANSTVKLLSENATAGTEEWLSEMVAALGMRFGAVPVRNDGGNLTLL
jgi:hypothetical protein